MGCYCKQGLKVKKASKKRKRNPTEECANSPSLGLQSNDRNLRSSSQRSQTAAHR
jgi:hypothetical protein